jgi:hypothetical protein
MGGLLQGRKRMAIVSEKLFLCEDSRVSAAQKEPPRTVVRRLIYTRNIRFFLCVNYFHIIGRLVRKVRNENIVQPYQGAAAVSRSC